MWTLYLTYLEQVKFLKQMPLTIIYTLLLVLTSLNLHISYDTDALDLIAEFQPLISDAVGD